MSGLRFECTQCGRCCRNNGEFAHVYLNREEVVALADFLGLRPSVFRRRHTFKDEYGWTQLRTSGPRCPFLDDDNGTCTVYEARPTQCRTFPFWRETIRDGEWTQEVRENCEGVGRGRLYSIQEAEVLMREMDEAEET